MNKTIDRKKNLPLLLLSVLLGFLIVCPLVTIFAKAVITDGRLDFCTAWQTLIQNENAVMIGNSLLLACWWEGAGSWGGLAGGL